VEGARVQGQLRLLVPRVGAPLVWLQQGRGVDVALVGLATWAALALALGLRTPPPAPPAPAVRGPRSRHRALSG
jgi:hypothetical protein